MLKERWGLWNSLKFQIYIPTQRLYHNLDSNALQNLFVVVTAIKVGLFIMCVKTTPPTEELESKGDKMVVTGNKGGEKGALIDLRARRRWHPSSWQDSFELWEVSVYLRAGDDITAIPVSRVPWSSVHQQTSSNLQMDKNNSRE